MPDISKIEIRDARPADVPGLAPLMEQLGYPIAEQALLERMAQAADSGRNRAIVAADGGTVVGFVFLHVIPLPMDGALARLTAVCVAETHRSCGLGARLIAEAERTAAEFGCARLEVTSSARRVRAHAFYERLGYREHPKIFRKDVPRPAAAE